MKRSPHVLIASAFGGLAGAFAMRQLVRQWDRANAYHPRHGAFGLDEEADIRSMRLLAAALSKPAPSDRQALRMATAFHYGYGVAGGLAYAVASERIGWLRNGRGLGFGLLVWIVGDELPITLAGISCPLKKSTGSHAVALLAHMIYAVMIDSSIRCVSSSR
jgi:hypothetical protein